MKPLEKRPMWSYILVSVIGAALSTVYWIVINLEVSRIATPSQTVTASPDLKPSEPWHLAIETSLAGGSRGLEHPDPYNPATISGIWIVFTGSFGNTACPSNMALFVRITNLTDRPQTIEHLFFEALGLNTGKWQKLTRLPLAFNHAYYGFGNLKGAAPLSFQENALDGLLTRPIPPGQENSVSGWDLIEYPDGFALSGTPLRCTIRDILGHDYQTVVPFPTADETNSGSINPRRVLQRIGPFEDLSGYHIDYWTNTHAH